MKEIFPLLFFSSCIGAGDMFAKREKIIGNYYLIESESSDHYSIAYKTTGVYVGRSPVNNKLLAYANNDSLLVMKMQSHDSTIRYFVVNMKKDSDTAKDKEIFIDTLDGKNFKGSWVNKPALSFQEVK